MPDPSPGPASQVIYRVAVPSPLRRVFDYLPATEDTVTPPAGVRVRVPFGRRRLTGVLLEIRPGSDIDPSRLRRITAVLDSEPLFSPDLLKLLLWATDYYQHPPGEVFSAALPALLRQSKPLHGSSTERWHTNTDAAAAQRILCRAPRQQALFELLHKAGSMDRRHIINKGYSSELLRQLARKQLVCRRLEPTQAATVFDCNDVTAEPSLALSTEQQQAVNTVTARPHQYRCFLLDGITGSGKTEVYMQTMTAVLASGRQCLVLVPEIGLTPQTIARFRRRFHCPVVTLHSGLSDTERMAAWSAARSGAAGIVIGTRSAVFTPLARPGLIIVDEEHDQSFKQQDGFRYSARDLAVMRGHQESVPVILGSATPSLESLHNARQGKFTHLCLDSRAGSSRPAVMRVIDTAELGLKSGFSDMALMRIKQELAAGNQALVFINRRGFAPMLHCLTCGWVAECDDCVARFTLHSQPPSLRCHHCGRQQQVPSACPQCAARDLANLGQGTQKIESLLSTMFPDFPVLRVDRDSTRSKKRFEAMLEQLNSGEPCVLLGTQMLAKGHHFPTITLVVILDADSGLFSADFRGQEHMAQTIVQVAGRAGRADRAGEVLIQSRHATHATLRCLVSLPYREFALQLLRDREQAQMPPFAHLALLRAEANSINSALSFLERLNSLLNSLPTVARVERLGPMPAPMEKRAGRFRCQLLLKSPSRRALQQTLGALLSRVETIKSPPRLRWSLDVDPLDLI